MKKPFFSVIIPTYNRAKFLKIALNSVLTQTFPNYELIVVDDGSTDATKQIIKKIKDKRLKYFYQNNKGPAGARNLGLKKAQGQFICFLDSDDRFCKEKLEFSFDYIQKYPESKVFHTEEIWYRNGRLLSPKKRHQKPDGFVFAQALKLCCISPSTTVIRKDVFDEIGCFDEEFLACEDYEFFLRLTSRYPVILIPEYLTIKQGGHRDQQSKKYPAMDSFRIYALEKILKKLPPKSTNYKLANAELKRKYLIYIKGAFNFRPNKNQLQEIERLIFEISRREAINPLEIAKHFRKNNFFSLKEALLKRRFPLTVKQKKIDNKDIYLNKIPQALNDNWPVKKTFKPLEIIVEKEVKNSYLLKNFRAKFPKLSIKEINHHSQYLKKNKFSLEELKKPLVFITKEKWDFLKPCPCTKNHLACGYWIFNLGFGCPLDCSYCFLQQYTNFPGIILPANLEDFFAKFDNFAKKLKKPIRIGTGEFFDSLALDHITEYSKKLIPYFSQKKVLFELKTKSANIDNLLKIKPSPKIIISWSLNPNSIIKTEEKAAASLKSRLEAAKKVKNHGYGLSFHFDPIIYSVNWNKLYQKVIDQLYDKLKGPFAWISLGTLRCNRKLKKMAEARFPETNIFYGELFIAEDKKLRYPKFLRRQIYQEMIEMIRAYDTKTPIYLCMEDKETWEAIGDFNSPQKIEKYLLSM